MAGAFQGLVVRQVAAADAVALALHVHGPCASPRSLGSMRDMTVAQTMPTRPRRSSGRVTVQLP